MTPLPIRATNQNARYSSSFNASRLDFISAASSAGSITSGNGVDASMCPPAAAPPPHTVIKTLFLFNEMDESIQLVYFHLGILFEETRQVRAGHRTPHHHALILQEFCKPNDISHSSADIHDVSGMTILDQPNITRFDTLIISFQRIAQSFWQVLRQEYWPVTC